MDAEAAEASEEVATVVAAKQQQDEEGEEEEEAEEERQQEQLQEEEEEAEEVRESRSERRRALEIDELEELMLQQHQAREQWAATVMQRQRRRVLMRRAMPFVHNLARRRLRERRACVNMQKVARGWLVRTEPSRLFRKALAIRRVQRAYRAGSHTRERARLLRHGGAGLSAASVERALAARSAFLLLSAEEREALLPTLLALNGGAIELMHQVTMALHMHAWPACAGCASSHGCCMSTACTRRGSCGAT